MYVTSFVVSRKYFNSQPDEAEDRSGKRSSWFFHEARQSVLNLDRKSSGFRISGVSMVFACDALPPKMGKGNVLCKGCGVYGS